MSRDKILKAIRQNKPETAPLPAPVQRAGHTNQSRSIEEAFTEKVIAVGGAVFHVKEKADLEQIILQQFNGVEKICSPTIELKVSSMDVTTATPEALEAVKLSVIEGEFGVAENGAVWVTEKKMGKRILPFITEHLMLVIPKESIVPDLHKAYEMLAGFIEGYGVFISGPSKTADIEQSLVKGAHGPLSLTVVMY